METTMPAPSSKKRRYCDCDTELRLRLGGGCADDDDPAPAPCARWEKKKAATTTGGAHCNAYADGDRLLTLAQHLVMVPAAADVTGAEVQASAIIRMARAAAGARDTDDRGASRRRMSLGRFLQRRREQWRIQKPGRGA